MTEEEFTELEKRIRSSVEELKKELDIETIKEKFMVPFLEKALTDYSEYFEDKTFSTMSFNILRKCIDCGKPTDVVAFFIDTQDGEMNVDCAGRCRECFRDGNKQYENIATHYNCLNTETLRSIYTEKEIDEFEDLLTEMVLKQEEWNEKRKRKWLK